MLFLHGRAGAADALALLHAESDAPPTTRMRQAATFIAEAEPPTFPLKGADLVARGVAPGRALAPRSSGCRQLDQSRISARSAPRAAIARGRARTARIERAAQFATPLRIETR